MSKKKANKPHLRLASNDGRTTIAARGLAENLDIVAKLDDPGAMYDHFQEVPLPEDEKVIIKEVPAKVDGVDVGTAEIYHDGTVGIRLNKDAPQWAIDKIKGDAAELGYSIGTED